MGKMIHDEREGYQYISDNGVEYFLFEGITLGGKATSDIVFMMADFNCEVFDSNDDAFVGWFFGASFTGDDYNSIDTLQSMADEYEKKNPKVVKYYKEKENQKAVNEFRVKVANKAYEIFKLMNEIDDLSDEYAMKTGDCDGECFFNNNLPVGDEYPFNKDWETQTLEMLGWSEAVFNMTKEENV